MLADTAELKQGNGGKSAKTRAGKLRLRTLNNLDARTAAYQRFKELVGSYSADLGDDLTTAQAAIIQRIVSLQVWCESIEVEYAETGALDIATFTTATNALRRLLADIGLERRARDVTPDIDAYLNHRAKEAAANG
jgi:hypothetical protein